MSEELNIDYGPLTELIGVWKGDKGMDIAPEPDGTEENPYYETITITEGGTVDNAESQTLSILFYHQIVKRKSNDEVFHDQIGYWLWDPRDKVIMHTLSIPRGVCLIAGGSHNGKNDADGNIVIELVAGIENKDWSIVQSPFMQQNAKTTDFQIKVIVGNGKMTYAETTMLDIYGRVFEHTDANELIRQ